MKVSTRTQKSEEHPAHGELFRRSANRERNVPKVRLHDEVTRSLRLRLRGSQASKSGFKTEKSSYLKTSFYTFRQRKLPQPQKPQISSGILAPTPGRGVNDRLNARRSVAPFRRFGDSFKMQSNLSFRNLRGRTFFEQDTTDINKSMDLTASFQTFRPRRQKNGQKQLNESFLLRPSSPQSKKGKRSERVSAQKVSKKQLLSTAEQTIRSSGLTDALFTPSPDEQLEHYARISAQKNFMGRNPTQRLNLKKSYKTILPKLNEVSKDYNKHMSLLKGSIIFDDYSQATKTVNYGSMNFRSSLFEDRARRRYIEDSRRILSDDVLEGKDQTVVDSHWAPLLGEKFDVISLPAQTSWTSRWGHGVVNVFDGYLLLIGGDDTEEETNAGGLRNDIWKIYDIGWNIDQSSETGQHKFLSNVKQELISRNELRVFEGDLLWHCKGGNSWKPSESCAEYKAPELTRKNKFSPRRNHGVAYFKGSVFVMGGEAYDFRDTATSDIPVNNKNDIWKSKERSVCNEADDCYGSSSCHLDTSASTGVQRCRCDMWSPRHSHQIQVLHDKIYVVGGIGNVNSDICGEKLCSANVVDIMNDVWESDDGRNWKKGDELLVADADGVQKLDFTSFLLEEDTAQPEIMLNKFSYHKLYPRETVIESKYYEQRFQVVTYKDTITRVVNSTQVQFLDQLDGIWNDPEPYKLVFPRMKMEYISFLTKEEKDELQRVGISNLVDLSRINREQVLYLRHVRNLKDICKYKQRAIQLISYCYEFPLFPYGYANDDFNQKLNQTKSTPPGHTSIYDVDVSSGYLVYLQTFYKIFSGFGAKISFRLLLQEGVKYASEFLSFVEFEHTNFRWPYMNSTKEVVRGIEPLHEYTKMSYGNDGCQQAYYFSDMLEELLDSDEDQAKKEMDLITGAACRISTADRQFFKLVVFQDELLMIAGKGHNDLWKLDFDPPNTVIRKFPQDRSSESDFVFICSEEPCLYQYKLIKNTENMNITIVHWNTSLGELFLENVLYETGTGDYTLIVRGVDPANNMDLIYEKNRNKYTWRYTKPIPFGRVLAILISISLLVLGSFAEYKRRKRQAALERYAMKRMQRKFKNLEKLEKNKEASEGMSKIKMKAKARLRPKKAEELRVETQVKADVKPNKISPTGEQAAIVNLSIPQKKKKKKRD
eukprot:augustus_masked-scaffold_13-processed-gene-7.45-mRNA-1 protein AED:1.00 eAED:1.00 QI:0/0/0/0/1/1/4/0/1162